MDEKSFSRFKIIKVQDIFVLTIIAFISFAIESTIGLFLIPIVPIPLVGGLLSGFLDAIIIFTGVYSIPRIGAAFYFGLLLLSLSTMTPSFGPPGIYKIMIGIGLGLICEIILLIFGRKDYVYILGTAVAFGASIPMTYLAWIQAQISVEVLRGYLTSFTAAYAVIGGIGAYLGLILYKKRLSKYALVRRIREGV